MNPNNLMPATRSNRDKSETFVQLPGDLIRELRNQQNPRTTGTSVDLESKLLLGIAFNSISMCR